MPNNLQQTSGGPLEVPEWMKDKEVVGIEQLGQFVIPPRIKICQKLSDDDVLAIFEVGDVYVSPQKILLAPLDKGNEKKSDDVSQPFHIVPIFFFAEACLWNPIATRGTLPAIRERVTDLEDPAFIKARNPKLWDVRIDNVDCRWVEHLNFIVKIINQPELGDTPIVLTFMKTGHKAGSNFASLLKMKKSAIYGGQFEVHSVLKSNNQGSWFSLEVANPSFESGVNPFVGNEEEYEVYAKLHTFYKDAHEASKLKVDHEECTSETTDEC